MSWPCARVGVVGATLAALALALAGCGLIAASAPTTVELLVTREFGSVALHRSGALRASWRETAIDLLDSELPVITGPGGSPCGASTGSPAARSGSARAER